MENKHEAYELAQMQSLSLDAKIRMTQRRIRDWYDYWDGQVYVSISGGKDSQVLAHIVKKMYEDVPLVFVNTGLEFDSVRLKGFELADIVLKPEMSFVEVINNYGYPIIGKEVAQYTEGAKRWMNKYHPGEKFCEYEFQQNDYETMTVDAKIMLGKLEHKKNGKVIEGEYSKAYDKSKYKILVDAPFRISHKCCNVMKKNAIHKYCKHSGRYGITGQMASESSLRYKQWIKNGCNGFELKYPISNPLSFWTEQDILHYIKKYELEIAEIYGKIVYTDNDGMPYDDSLFSEFMELTTTGAKRTGCVFCLFGITHDTGRLLKLKEAEPKKYDYVMRGGWFYYTVKDKNNHQIKLKHCKHETIATWCEKNMDNSNFRITKEWQPHKGLGYKFIIDWLNEHGNLDIKY